MFIPKATMAMLDELIEDMYAPPDVDETVEFQYYKKIPMEGKKSCTIIVKGVRFKMILTS